MSDRLPDRIDAARLAVQVREISGFLPMAEMPRLSEVLVDSAGDATGRFLFFRSASQGTSVRGHVEADLRVQCQRCMEPMDLAVSHDFEARLVSGDEELARVPESDDAIWMDQEGLSLHTLLEDELLLAVPVVPLHGPDSGCAAGSRREFGQGDITQARLEEKDNPFAILKSLKGSADKD